MLWPQGSYINQENAHAYTVKATTVEYEQFSRECDLGCKREKGMELSDRLIQRLYQEDKMNW